MFLSHKPTEAEAERLAAEDEAVYVFGTETSKRLQWGVWCFGLRDNLVLWGSFVLLASLDWMGASNGG
jgi:hypothetical protein